MKVLVTGATGFIGSYVVEALLRKGCSVMASARSEESARVKPWFGKVQFLPFDLRNPDGYEGAYAYFGHPDLLIHLAWEGLPNYKSLFHFEENLPRHYAFLKNMITGGLKDLTVTGTCFEYGFREGSLRESDPADPANSYALAKDSLRRFLEQLQKYQPFSFKWARLFYMYGAGQSPHSLFSQLERTLAAGGTTFNMSGGEQTRDYLPVSTVAEYIVSIALQRQTEGIINCCSGVPVQLKELVQRYLNERNATLQLNLGYYPYPDFEPMHFWGDNTKLKTISAHE